jgi:hypothetical protein
MKTRLERKSTECKSSDLTVYVLSQAKGKKFESYLPIILKGVSCVNHREKYLSSSNLFMHITVG